MSALPLVKICGITRMEDASAAVELGALAIGFVFWPGSPRAMDPYRARDIARNLPPFVTPVGVFVNQPVDYVNAVAALVGLGVAQLHGDEDPQFAAAVKRPVLKAVTLSPAAEAARWPDRVMILVDAHDRGRRGGTGTTADWSAAAAVAGTRRVVLAGGLTPDNVGQAVARVRPFGIDVSSGVESAPGIKDRRLLAALFERLRQTVVETGSRA
jgi:phosphoribosylanthranilate isomerase